MKFDATPFRYVRMYKMQDVGNEWAQGSADANGLARIPGSATDWTWWLIDFVA